MMLCQYTFAKKKVQKNLRKIARRISLARYLPQTSQFEDILDTAKEGFTGSYVLLSGKSVNTITNNIRNLSHRLSPRGRWGTPHPPLSVNFFGAK